MHLSDSHSTDTHHSCSICSYNTNSNGNDCGLGNTNITTNKSKGNIHDKQRHVNHPFSATTTTTTTTGTVHKIHQDLSQNQQVIQQQQHHKQIPENGINDRGGAAGSWEGRSSALIRKLSTNAKRLFTSSKKSPTHNSTNNSQNNHNNTNHIQAKPGVITGSEQPISGFKSSMWRANSDEPAIKIFPKASSATAAQQQQLQQQQQQQPSTRTNLTISSEDVSPNISTRLAPMKPSSLNNSKCFSKVSKSQANGNTNIARPHSITTKSPSSNINDMTAIVVSAPDKYAHSDINANATRSVSDSAKSPSNRNAQKKHLNLKSSLQESKSFSNTLSLQVSKSFCNNTNAIRAGSESYFILSPKSKSVTEFPIPSNVDAYSNNRVIRGERAQIQPHLHKSRNELGLRNSALGSAASPRLKTSASVSASALAPLGSILRSSYSANTAQTFQYDMAREAAKFKAEDLDRHSQGSKIVKFQIENEAPAPALVVKDVNWLKQQLWVRSNSTPNDVTETEQDEEFPIFVPNVRTKSVSFNSHIRVLSFDPKKSTMQDPLIMMIKIDDVTPQTRKKLFAGKDRIPSHRLSCMDNDNPDDEFSYDLHDVDQMIQDDDIPIIEEEPLHVIDDLLQIDINAEVDVDDIDVFSQDEFSDEGALGAEEFTDMRNFSKEKREIQKNMHALSIDREKLVSIFR